MYLNRQNICIYFDLDIYKILISNLANFAKFFRMILLGGPVGSTLDSQSVCPGFEFGLGWSLGVRSITNESSTRAESSSYKTPRT